MLYHDIINLIKSYQNTLWPTKTVWFVKSGIVIQPWWKSKDWITEKFISLFFGEEIPYSCWQNCFSHIWKRGENRIIWTLTYRFYSGESRETNPKRKQSTRLITRAEMSAYTLPRDVFPLALNCLLFLTVFGLSQACLEDLTSAYRFTGAVCRLTYPAAVVCKRGYFNNLEDLFQLIKCILIFPLVIVVNEKTTKVIEAAFQHARYPSMKGEKSLAFVGKIIYGLDK